MAFESYYWKKDLKRDISYIQKKVDVKIWDLDGYKFDEHFSKIEIKLFLMAFSIRKLLESQRLPDSAKNLELKCVKYKRNSRIQSLSFDYEKLYDFDKSIKTNLSLVNLLNQFIHAHVLQVLSSRNGCIRRIFVTSDWQKEDCLYSLDIKDFLTYILKISKMQVKSMHRTYDPIANKITTVIN
ncbi:MAG: hypothetical protein KBD55_00465 [Candidatus Pacebacteria bacterium]|nr:hypothetical protein [Candidatus Paceibacterota bacterium]